MPEQVSMTTPAAETAGGDHPTAGTPVGGHPVDDGVETLIEDVSIDGMCGVY